MNGADYWLKNYGKLPNYYVSREEFENAGWSGGKPPRKYLPNKMIFGGVFNNREGKLPIALSRIMVGAHFMSDVLMGGTFSFILMIISREIFILKGASLKSLFQKK